MYNNNPNNLKKHFELIEKPTKIYDFELVRQTILGDYAINCSNLKAYLGYSRTRILGISTLDPKEFDVFRYQKHHYLPLKHLRKYFEEVASRGGTKAKKGLAELALTNNLPEYLIARILLVSTNLSRLANYKPHKLVCRVDLEDFGFVRASQKLEPTYQKNNGKWEIVRKEIENLEQNSLVTSFSEPKRKKKRRKKKRKDVF